jgi:hypothetical protein
MYTSRKSDAGSKKDGSCGFKQRRRSRELASVYVECMIRRQEGVSTDCRAGDGKQTMHSSGTSPRERGSDNAPPSVLYYSAFTGTQEMTIECRSRIDIALKTILL